MASAAFAAAGTVVTEIATPTSAPDFDEVSDSIPAMPARKATTKESQVGCQMNCVAGWGASKRACVNSPRPLITKAKPPVSSIAAGKPTASAIAERATSRPLRRTRPVQTPASGPNSGPTTIAPTIRIELSSITP